MSSRTDFISPTTRHDTPIHLAQPPDLPARLDRASARPYDTQTPIAVIGHSPPQTTRQSLPYIDDGGLPEVVLAPEEPIDIMPDCDPRKIRERELLPELPPRYSISKHDPILSQPPRMSRVSSATVTPLGLLGDQPDMVDCPFCQKRVMTRVKKKASMTTHVAATTLFFATLGGGVVPYAKNWRAHVSHHCSNCDAKVAEQRNGQGEMQPFGTPEHLRHTSRYEAAAR